MPPFSERGYSMKLGVLVAAALGLAGVATSAAAECSVVTNEVVIVNNGVFLEAGVPIPLQLKVQWRVDGSMSGFLDVPHGSSISRPYPGNYPLMVDLQYSDKLRTWHNGGSIDIVAAVNEKLQQACQISNGPMKALTQVIMAEASVSGVGYGIEASFLPADKP